jgi:hypothetical protein
MSPVPAGPPLRRSPDHVVWPRPVALRLAPDVSTSSTRTASSSPMASGPAMPLPPHPGSCRTLKGLYLVLPGQAALSLPPRGRVGCGSLWRLPSIGWAARSRGMKVMAPTREPLKRCWASGSRLTAIWNTHSAERRLVQSHPRYVPTTQTALFGSLSTRSRPRSRAVPR